MFSGLAWVGSRNPHPFFWGRGDRASCFLMPWPHGGIRDSIWLCHFSRLKYSWAAAPHSRVAAGDWLGSPVVSDSCRVVLVMAAKWQKSSGNIIEFSLFIVAVCSWPNKEGTSWIQKKKKIGSTSSKASLMPFHCQKVEQAKQNWRHIDYFSSGLFCLVYIFSARGTE